jgi:hypothetical protein
LADDAVHTAFFAILTATSQTILAEKNLLVPENSANGKCASFRLSKG